MQIMTNSSISARQKDGALHMIGAVAQVLLKVTYTYVPSPKDS